MINEKFDWSGPWPSLLVKPQIDLNSCLPPPSPSTSQTMMDSRVLVALLLVSSFLCTSAKAESSGTVLFIDGQQHHYLRSPSTNGGVQSMSIPEVADAVSVLLGFAPSATLSAAGSAKLNGVLSPNPFDRPRAVFMLEVTGSKALSHAGISAMDKYSHALRRNTVLGSEQAQIELPGGEVSVVHLDEGLADFTEKEINDLASFLGGSYVADTSQAMNGDIMGITLASGTMNLHMSKEADRKYVGSLLALMRNSKRAKLMHEDLSQGTRMPAELIIGSFDGIKALREQYGTESIVQQGEELLLSMLSMVLDSLQVAYKGKLVAVVSFEPESETKLDVVLTDYPSARLLVETNVSPVFNTTILEVALVRTTLAWLTGIILLVSTLIGVCMLFNMPLTKDTLLYSNVKLD
ncbi:unnamed protein product [Linum tenue]|uniref:DUF7794 domain-containing protein n=1 Tax=Linum tenue TaxID=586396 RepID=A0AAV0LTC7_9ROSI|nr:unnamed protein product [Linum tenue]